MNVNLYLANYQYISNTNTNTSNSEFDYLGREENPIQDFKVLWALDNSSDNNQQSDLENLNQNCLQNSSEGAVQQNGGANTTNYITMATENNILANLVNYIYNNNQQSDFEHTIENDIQTSGELANEPDNDV